MESATTPCLDHFLSSGNSALSASDFDSDPAFERRCSLTPVGIQMYEEAAPYWQRADERLRRAMGDDGKCLLHSVADMAAQDAAAAETARRAHTISVASKQPSPRGFHVDGSYARAT